MSIARTIRLAAALVATLLAPSIAAAQMPEISPTGEAPTAPSGDSAGVGPYDAAPAPGTSVTAQPAGEGVPNTDGVGGTGGGYYHTDLDGRGGSNVPLANQGPVPDVHVVRQGDTLWDLCAQYFNSPWEWPRIWSYNPEISNPHWIYPSDQIRLRVAGAPLTPAEAEAEAQAKAPATSDVPRSNGPRDIGFSLRQIAFVDLDDLHFAGRIDGSPDEKAMLARGDEVYLAYPAGKPPKVGSRHSIYLRKRDVKSSDGDHAIGAYVIVVGEVEILSVKKDKRARAIVIDSTDPIERTHLVGPLKQRFANLRPTPATADVQSTIVGMIGPDQLIGARQVVFLDKGSAAGLKVGNRLYAVRRGDAYPSEFGPMYNNIGQDDRRFPARAIGELMIVEAGKDTSLAVVTVSVQELGIGDHVVLSRATN
jgi:hypothetical protein